jgi:hypothetical protein
MAALGHVVLAQFHVVAEIIEAQLVVGGVGDVGGIGGLALLVVEAVDDGINAEAEEAIDLPHPFRIALGQVVVDGDDMDAVTGNGVQINRERGDQGLDFAGLHLGDVALVQNHAADELNVEMALAESAFCGLADGREGRHQ